MAPVIPAILREDVVMKRFLMFVLLLVAVLCACSIAFATTNNTLPSEIESYFSVGDSTILDYADLTGHGTDDCWFVMVRTKDGTNILYCFKLKENGWYVQFRTSDAVPQTKRGLHINVGEGGYEGPAATYPYNRPLLFIGQENEFGDHWDLCISFELQRGKWLLRRIWSYIGYDHMLVKDGSITYYVDNENERIAGTVKGTVQRNLQYVSLSAIPKTLAEAKKKLTIAPDLPQSSELKVYPVTFTGKKKYDVYSAPDNSSIRGANGKARVSTNSWIQVFGTEGDWVLIQYSIDASHYRFGYITKKSLPKKSEVPELAFRYQSVYTINAINVTDDPLYSRDTIVTLPSGAEVTLLATLGDDAYIEGYAGKQFRGFVPLMSLSKSVSTFAAFTASDGTVYDLFTVTKLHYDSGHHVNAVSGYYERFVPGDESDGSEKAEGSNATYLLAEDFHADMVNSMTSSEMTLIPVTDLHQWYVNAYIGRENYDGHDFVFSADLTDEQLEIVDQDFWFVTTQIELNDRNEVQFMKYVYVPWG